MSNKIPNIRIKKRNHTYSFAFEAGKHSTGKRRVIEKGGFPTIEKALRAGESARKLWLVEKRSSPGQGPLLRDFLETFLNRISGEVRESSMRAYRSHARVIGSLLGNKNLRDITPEDIDQLMLGFVKKGISYQTIRARLSFLRRAFSYAAYPLRMISENPAACIRIPRSAPRKCVERKIITSGEYSALLEKYPYGHPLHLLIVLAYHTGMRCGELLGLTWKNVDFANLQIHVACQRQKLPGKPSALVLPKTKTSIRDIPIARKLAKLLKRWKKDQKRYTKDGRNPLNLVCTNSSGTPASRTAFERALKAEGLNSHSFRHTHATRLAELSAPFKDIAARLGHSSTTLAENLYTHHTAQMSDMTRKILEYL